MSPSVLTLGSTGAPQECWGRSAIRNTFNLRLHRFSLGAWAVRDSRYCGTRAVSRCGLVNQLSSYTSSPNGCKAAFVRHGADEGDGPRGIGRRKVPLSDRRSTR